MIVEPLLKFYSRTMLLMKMGRAGDMGTCEGFVTAELVVAQVVLVGKRVCFID